MSRTVQMKIEQTNKNLRVTCCRYRKNIIYYKVCSFLNFKLGSDICFLVYNADKKCIIRAGQYKELNRGLVSCLTFPLCGHSGEEGPVAGEGGEGAAPEGEPAGGPPEEAGGAAAESREAPGAAGGEAEAEAGEEQGRATTSSLFQTDVILCLVSCHLHSTSLGGG